MKLRITCIAALMVLGLSSFALGATTYTYNGHEYALTSPGSWSEAEAEAVAWGGHLVTINNQAEQDWLVSKFPFTDPAYQGIMIGFNDIQQEGTWVWVSGEPVTYTNWCTYGEPNNGGVPGGNEDVAIMNWGNEPTIPYQSWWNDVPGDNGIGIMERTAPVPVPAAALLLGSGLIGLLGLRRKIQSPQA